jgi:site-specific DNA recombinase
MQALSKAIILARVSSKAQEDEGYSLDAQLKLMREYCKSKTLVPIKEFRVAETASKQERRKVFQELLIYIIRHRIYHLIVEKTDRLTRNYKDAVSVDEWLEGDEKRVLHLVKENIQLHKNSRSDTKFMLNIYLAFAKKYIDNLREEAMKGWAEKLAQGWLPAPPPPGYMTVTESGKKIHVPNLPNVPLMQRTFQLYATPNHNVTSINSEMTAMGLVTSKGRPFSRSYTSKILGNPFYIGINRFDGKDYPGAQEPIISKALFKAVQEKLHRRGLCASRTKHDPIFKAMIRCSTCGKGVTWSKHKGRYYGSCSRWELACNDKRMLREDRVERTVISSLEELDALSGKALRKARLALQVIRQQDVGMYRERTIEALNKQLDRIGHMDDMLYDDKLAGEISQEVYENKHRQFAGQTAEIHERLGRLHEAQDRLRVVASPEVETESPLVRLYVTSTPGNKRMIMATLFQIMTADGDKLTVAPIASV